MCVCWEEAHIILAKADLLLSDDDDDETHCNWSTEVLSGESD